MEAWVNGVPGEAGDKAAVQLDKLYLYDEDGPMDGGSSGGRAAEAPGGSCTPSSARWQQSAPLSPPSADGGPPPMPATPQNLQRTAGVADARARGSGTASPSGTPGQRQPVGWGGQAISEAASFRVPWFGRNRGKSSSGQGDRSNGGGRGRGRGGGRSGRMRRTWSGSASDADSRPCGSGCLGVEELVGLVASASHDAPLPGTLFDFLSSYDSRGVAVFLKDLAKAGLTHRAAEVFDALRGLPDSHPLAGLADVYTYTAAISLCIGDHDCDRGIALSEEMARRGVPRNVHTYTALMNVCIKAGKYGLALDTYARMREDGCPPNVVTFNTLIDVHGKRGQWEQATKVLDDMRAEGVEPVLRTYNTLIIACNMCNQPREAQAVYKRLVCEGHKPNGTTYNALISAYGKAGQLERVMEVFKEMVWKGCERSVITYSSLISACEKAGQWQLALDLFGRMHTEGLKPNTVTYNSLITACAQGAQCEKAGEVYEAMRRQGCAPDVVTYTALISAYEKGGQWVHALQVYEAMRKAGTVPDAIVYNAIIDTLWGTGVVWAHRKALQLFEVAASEGHFAQQLVVPGAQHLKVSLHAMTAGVAMLSLYTSLLRLRALVLQRENGGLCGLPPRLFVVSDRGKGGREAGNLVVKEATQALLAAWDSPFGAAIEGGPSPGTLEAPGDAVAAWLTSRAFTERMCTIFPFACEVTVAGGRCSRDSQCGCDEPASAREARVEARCVEAFAAVTHFERTHCLVLQAMSAGYLAARHALVARALEVGDVLGVGEEVAHDAVLLMDRTMSASPQVQEGLMQLLLVACLSIAVRQGMHASQAPSYAEVQEASGMQGELVQQMEWNVAQVLGGDTSTISTLRCLKLYLERLGADFAAPAAPAALAGGAFAVAREALVDAPLLNCRPSVIAAAILYAERRVRGAIPFWPSTLAKLTGYQDMSTPELSIAIKVAQRLCARLGVAVHATPALHGAVGGPSAGAGTQQQLRGSADGTAAIGTQLHGHLLSGHLA